MSGADAGYYGRPVLHEPVWIWTVPAYFYAGGAAGAAAVLGGVAQAVGGGGLGGLVRRCRQIAAAGSGAGTALLIWDLGRPERFLNMLRVFRPSSPMSVGSWVLAAFVPSAAAAALAPRRRLPGYVAAALGAPLATYTGVLLGTSAVPIWQAARRAMPVLFACSAAASAADLLALGSLSPAEEAVARRFGAAGRAGELVASLVLEAGARRVPAVAGPLCSGWSGALWRAAQVLAAAALAADLWPRAEPWAGAAGGRRGGRWAHGGSGEGGRRWARAASGARMRRLAAVLGTTGAVALRFAIWQAGVRSARDPRATFDQQRAGGGGFEVTGRAAVSGPHGERAV